MIQLLLGGAALFGGYEAYKWYRLKYGKGFAVIPGHLFTINYKVGANAGQGAAPTRAVTQAALDTSAHGLWDVVADPYASAIPGSFVVQAVYSGPAAGTVTAQSLSSGFGSACVVTDVQDMGGVPQAGA